MKILFLTIVSVSLLAGCTKKEAAPPLPALTTHGANTLGCRINGEVFAASGISFQSVTDGVNLIPYTDGWYIRGVAGNKRIYMQIDFASNPTVPATFPLGRREPFRGRYMYFPDGTVPSGSTEWLTDESRTGTVTVTSYTKTWASGTFQFDAMNGDSNIVKIEDGRFDISF